MVSGVETGMPSRWSKDGNTAGNATRERRAYWKTPDL